MVRSKYPRTPHLPFSLGQTDDDKVLDTDKHFYAMNEVIVSYKMDGENTTIYPDGYCHARSIDSKHKSYHSWLMQYIQQWCYFLPQNYSVCGEYMYAKHSIEYTNLLSYFYAFSVWNNDICLSWDDTVAILSDLGVCLVPVIYRGKYDTNLIKNLANEAVKKGQEGIVVRNSLSFKRKDFAKNVAKFVRANHVQTDKHWTQSVIVANRLGGSYA